MNLVPKKMFLTTGVGTHKDKLASFELALRMAGIEKCNLVYVSSILPPLCKIVSKKEGVKLLSPGGITYCVMARNETDEPSRLVSAAIGIATPSDKEAYGYLSEHHSFGEKKKKVSDYAEDLAASMLATTLNIKFNPESAWDERAAVYRASGKIFRSRSIAQTALGGKKRNWTTVVAAAVFIL